MRIAWQVDDGYAGGSRPKHTDIDDSDLEGLNRDDRESFIQDAIQEDFNQRISWFEISRD